MVLSNFLLATNKNAKTQWSLTGGGLLQHSSYNIEKVLNFASCLEKSSNSVYVPTKYLISLLGLERSFKFSTLFMPDTFFCKMRFFCQGKSGSSSV